MSLTTIAAYLSTIIAIYSTVPYVVAILKRKTKPHQLSWLVFFIMNSIVFGSQFLEGGRGSTLIALAFAFGSLAVFILSFKYGSRDTSKLDRLLFTFALTTIVVWFFTKSNVTAIWLTVAIDIAATTMIILKLKTQPNSEAALPWLLGTIAYFFSCLSLIGSPLDVLFVRPVYGLICDAVIVLAIIHYTHKYKRKDVSSPAVI